MKSLQKRVLKSFIVIICSMIFAIISVLLRSFLISKIGHETEITFIFKTGSLVAAVISFFYIIYLLTDNMGDGIKD